MLKKITILLSIAPLFSFSHACAVRIENIFPDAFKESSGINISPKSIGGIDGYEIQEFQEQKNRNHFDSRREDAIQFLVMHYTVEDFPSTLQLFTENILEGRVSAHYVLTQEEAGHGIKGGIPIQIVPEDKRAWHAGISSWGSVKNLNATSIGIENVNEGFIGQEANLPTWFPFDRNQIESLGRLSGDIIRRYKILPQNVIGHADIAPLRKQDPGILFPWEELYTQHGVGAWLSREERNPDFISAQYLPKESLPQGISDAFFLKSLRKYGYDVPEGGYITPDHEGVVKAFKSHFSHNQFLADHNQFHAAYNQFPAAYNAKLDENAMLWAWGLEAKYSQK